MGHQQACRQQLSLHSDSRGAGYATLGSGHHQSLPGCLERHSLGLTQSEQCSTVIHRQGLGDGF